MKFKSDATFKDKLTCGSKYDMKDLVNFLKYNRFEVKKNADLSFMKLNSDAKIE